MRRVPASDSTQHCALRLRVIPVHFERLCHMKSMWRCQCCPTFPFSFFLQFSRFVLFTSLPSKLGRYLRHRVILVHFRKMCQRKSTSKWTSCFQDVHFTSMSAYTRQNDTHDSPCSFSPLTFPFLHSDFSFFLLTANFLAIQTLAMSWMSLVQHAPWPDS